MEFVRSRFSTEDTIEALKEYWTQAEDYLGGNRESAPDEQLVCSNLLPLGSILEMKSMGANSVGAVIRHSGNRNPRIFDAWYFACMRLMELSGGTFQFHQAGSVSKGNLKYYVAFRHSKIGRYRVEMLRVILNTEPGMVSAQLPSDHHDYRRSALDKIEWSRGNAPLRGRSEAIALCPRPGGNFVAAISAGKYNALLKRGFALADQLYLKQSQS